MPNSDQANDVASYAAGVRSALAHLPDAERKILLEDLESHLEEVASESGAPLEERLGKPADYAAELRAAYGSGDIGVASRRVPMLDRMQSLISAMLGTWAYRELAVLLPQLRPGWWVLRAYLLVLFFALAFKGQHNLRPIPNPFTSLGMLEIVATVVAIAISVRIGRRGIPSGAMWRGVAVAGNVGIVLLAIPTLAQMSTDRAYPLSITDSGNYSAYQMGYYGPMVTNIYPYSQDGKALKEILLYDQNGRPLTIMNTKEQVTDYPVGADGKPISNEYPLSQRHYNGDPVVPPRVAIPPSAQSSTPTPTPTPTP